LAVGEGAVGFAVSFADVFFVDAGCICCWDGEEEEGGGEESQ